MNVLCQQLRNTAPETPTLFTSELRPTVPDLSLSPDLQGLQQTLSECVRAMLRATQNVATFVNARFPENPDQAKAEKHTEEKEREIDEDGDNAGLAVATTQDFRARNYFNALTRDYPTIALIISMTNKMKEFEPMLKDYLQRFNTYSFLWESDGDKQFQEFEAKQPSIREIKEKMDNFLDLESKIEEIAERHVLDQSSSIAAVLRTHSQLKRRSGSRNMVIFLTRLVVLRCSLLTTSSKSKRQPFQRVSMHLMISDQQWTH